MAFAGCSEYVQYPPTLRGWRGICIIHVHGGTHEQSWTDIQLADFQSLKLATHLTLNLIVATWLHVCGGHRRFMIGNVFHEW